MNFIDKLVGSVKNLFGVKPAPKPAPKPAAQPKVLTWDDLNKQMDRVQAKINPQKEEFWNKYIAVNNYKAKNTGSGVASYGRPAVGVGTTSGPASEGYQSPIQQYIQPKPQVNWGAYLPFINQLAQSANRREATPMSVDITPYLNTAEIIRKRRMDQAGGLYG